MKFNLNNEKIAFLSPAVKRSFTKEETTEIIIPDTMPDVFSVVCAEAVPLMRTKDSENGRITVSGVCQTTALYLPEDNGGVQRVEATIGFNASVDDVSVTDNDILSAHIRALSAGARIINSRKIMVKVELVYDVAAWTPSYLRADSGGADCDGMQYLVTPIEITAAKAAGEKTFSVTDSAELSGAGGDAGSITVCGIDFTVDEVKSISSKALVKGSASVDVIYISDNRLKSALCKCPFSQLLELEGIDEESVYDLSIMPTGIYVSRDYMNDESGAAISIELHAVAQCTVYGTIKAAVVADVYNLDRELCVESGVSEIAGRETCTILAADTDGVMESDDEIAFVSHISSKCSQTAIARKDNALEITVPVCTEAICVTVTGETVGITRKTQAKLNYPADDNEYTACASLTGAAAYTVNGSRLSFHAPVGVRICAGNVRTINYIDSVSFDDENVKDKASAPSINVCRVSDGDTLWSLCKRYNCTRERAMRLNGLESEEIEAGAALLFLRE